jgi:Lar family restriction alleviation protein
MEPFFIVNRPTDAGGWQSREAMLLAETRRTPPMTTDEQLLPCPFCGEADAFSERADFSSSYIVCNNCQARGPIECQDSDEEEEPGRDSAIAAWNNRMEAVRPPVGEEVALKAICRERCAQVGDPPCFELSPTDWNYHSNMDECGCDKIARAALLAMQSNG